MLETLKKKWWLVAIVVVVGAVLLNNAGVINKSLEKTLKSQDVWEVTMKNPRTGEMETDDVSYWKFDKEDVYQGRALEDVREMKDDVVKSKASAEYVDKNTVTIKAEAFKDGTISVKVDDLNQDKMKGKITVHQNGMEVSTDVELKAAK